MAATWRIGFTDIPAKVLINNILPLCEVKDVLSFGCTNNFFALIASDEAFWKRKLAVDYNFTGSETTRTSDRKFIYQRLRNPRVFVWGCVTFSFYYSTRRSFVCRCIHACSPDRNHSEKGTWASLGCHGFQTQNPRMFLFRSNFIFQASAWSAWQRVKRQCRVWHS